MRTDREALIAGIAADPHNDLRKLVFADWLDEHGEADRAEFIRLAVGNKKAATRTKATEKRAKALFTKHWRKWFGPFLEALDPKHGLKGYENVPDQFRFRSSTASRPLLTFDPDAGLGLVTGLGLDLAAAPPGLSLDRALRLEPVSYLSLSLAGEPRWQTLTGPSLDQIRSMYVTERGRGRRNTLADFERVVNDRNLTGLTDFSLSVRGRNGRTIPLSVAATFATSHLARTVRKLRLFEVDVAGLRLVCESRRFKLETLFLRGHVSRRWGELLSSAGFASTTNSLHIQDSGSGSGRVSPMVAAVADGDRWKALTSLVVCEDDSRAGVTAAGLRALAKASFLPQLEVLSIPLDDKPDPKLITAVVERLDPARVRSLLFEQRGDVPMPDCFARKFGDRAHEGVDEEHANAHWQVLPEPLQSS